jgi:outer membrane protein OmpA-like peptidoglycan-associated protein
MSCRRSIAGLNAAIAIVLTTACVKAHIPHPDRRKDLIVLLPDPGGKSVGRAAVTNVAETVDLISARDSTLVAPNQPPTPVVSMSEADVTEIFGDALTALPPPPQTFTLYFRFDSEELTDDSRALVNDVLRSVKNRPFPDVVVLGHTDTMGTRERNFELGLKRANTVRALLIETGLAPASIEVLSHGEDELLVRTPDEVFEPRNRRVEITVR